MKFSTRFEYLNNKMVRQRLQLISSWLLWEVFENIPFLTILVIVCQIFCALDSPKDPDDYSSYAKGLLKKRFLLVFFGEILYQNDPNDGEIPKRFRKLNSVEIFDW